MADRNEELLSMAEAIRTIIRYSDYKEINFKMTRPMAEALADLIEERCQSNERRSDQTEVQV